MSDLRVLFEQYIANPDFEPKYQDYKQAAEQMEAIRRGAPLKEDFVQAAWSSIGFGGIGISPWGLLPKASYAANAPMCEAILQKLIVNPSPEQLDAANAAQNAEKETGRLRWKTPAVLHRILAIADPRRYSCAVVWQTATDPLRRWVQKQLGITVPQGNWAIQDSFIRAELAKQGLADVDPCWLGLFINHLARKPPETGNESLLPRGDEMAVVAPDGPLPPRDSPLNQILYGPPGTGKTYLTVEKALRILRPDVDDETERSVLKAAFDEEAKKGHIRFVTFHQSFSYEDFVEGIRAVLHCDAAGGETGRVVYRVEAGLFKKLCAEAAKHPGQPYVLIIDEINRGNIAGIFGELITLIEPSKRQGTAEALSTRLPYSGEPFSVPGNVYLIGTMNTADRSLTGLDVALRRRFSFVKMPPRPDYLDNVRLGGSPVTLGEMLRRMNQRIGVLLDADHAVGHAPFMDLRGDCSLPALARVFRESILPLLEDYFFEDWEKIGLVLNDPAKAAEFQFVRKENLAAALFGKLNPNQLPRQDSWVQNENAFEHWESFLGIVDVHATAQEASTPSVPAQPVSTPPASALAAELPQ